VRVGKLGVDLSVQTNGLRNQSRLEYAAQRNVGGRNGTEIGGVWIDEGFTDQTPVVAVKAQSDAYFRILERHAQVKDVFQLGNHLVWLTPSGTALVIDTGDGKDRLSDEEIDHLFVARK
jgi:Ca-activated chloride channel family protein